MTRLLLSLLAATAIARADFDPLRWQFRRGISIGKPEPVATFTVDSAMYRGSRARLSDLRIIRDSAEIPYLIRVLSGSHEEREWSPALLNKAVAPGTGLQATLDLGAHPTHNRLRIATRQKNFKQRVRIETGDDGRNWSIARDDGYVFDFSQGDRHVSVLTVDYPDSTRRFVKFTIFGWTDPEYLDSAWLTYYTAASGTVDSLATLAATATEDSKTQSTLLTADIGFEGLPYDRLQMMVDAGPFYRTVEIETSNDAKNWAFVGQSVISRAADREHTTIFFSEQWDRHIRLRILNHDSPPLAVRRLTLSAYRRVVEFPANTAGQYWLYYGNADAKQPVYDFAQTLSQQAKAVVYTLGQEQPNPAYRPPVPPEKPWSDRHPGVLYTVLIAAILIMGAIAVRFLLKINR
jgi:hypothetical protein